MTQLAGTTQNLQRKAAIAHGGAVEHHGEVLVSPIRNFDLNRTIFNTLEGKVPRFIMRTRIAKEAHWSERASKEIERAYAGTSTRLPEIDPKLLAFMEKECNFDAEHADGSFMEHLLFCFEYGAKHYPQGSALVLLLHSILGTGTNTFAMKAEKLPQLRALLNDSDWKHIEAFPSVLRLLTDLPLRRELRQNLDRWGSLRQIHFHRVIDNAPLSMTGEDFFTHLNYHLIHLVDFVPVSNWSLHASDTLFIVFRDLYDLMTRAGKREAHVEYTPTHFRRRDMEPESLSSIVTSLIPVTVSEKMAARALRKFSERIGHDISYRIDWA